MASSDLRGHVVIIVDGVYCHKFPDLSMIHYFKGPKTLNFVTLTKSRNKKNNY